MNVLRLVRPSAKVFSYVIGDNLRKSLKKYGITQSKRYFMGETYEGTGKTTGHIINKMGVSTICIDGITERGFILTNSWNVIGPAIFFPHMILSWKVKNHHCINKESLTLFSMLQPKVELLLFGYGRKEDMSYSKLKELLVIFNNLNVSFEIISTEDAAAIFNFCSIEQRFVAAALIPPSKITFHHGLDFLPSSKELTKIEKEV